MERTDDEILSEIMQRLQSTAGQADSSTGKKDGAVRGLQQCRDNLEQMFRGRTAPAQSVAYTVLRDVISRIWYNAGGNRRYDVLDEAIRPCYRSIASVLDLTLRKAGTDDEVMAALAACVSAYDELISKINTDDQGGDSR